MHRPVAARPPAARTCPSPPRGHRRGFTLIEMMMTVAVAAIFIGLGVPSVQRLFVHRAIATQAAELQEALHAARSEAMKRGGPVIICRIQAGDPGRCAGTAGDWQTWRVFADTNRSDAQELGEPLVRERLEVSRGLAALGEVASVRFESTGNAHAIPGAGNVVFLLGPAGPAPATLDASERRWRRQVCLNVRGVVAVVDGDAACPW